MFGKKKIEIINEKAVCWDSKQYYQERWAQAWGEWAKHRGANPSPKQTEKLWNAFVKADKELKAYVERVYG